MADPISMPCLGFVSYQLALVRTQDLAFMEGRRTETADFGTPYWKLSAQTGQLRDGRFEDAEWFVAEMQRAGRTFLAFDFFNQRPSAYGKTPLTDGAGVISAIANRRSISITGVQPGLLINRGALVEFRSSLSLRSLHRIMASVTATGGAATLSIEPALPENLDVGAIVNFERPSCVMMMTESDLVKARLNRTLSFSAVEAFFS